jgi:uncharacterized protein YpmB
MIWLVIIFLFLVTIILSVVLGYTLARNNWLEEKIEDTKSKIANLNSKLRSKNKGW